MCVCVCVCVCVKPALLHLHCSALGVHGTRCLRAAQVHVCVCVCVCVCHRNALTGLSKLHAQLNQSRARLGLAKPAFLQSFSVSVTHTHMC